MNYTIEFKISCKTTKVTVYLFHYDSLWPLALDQKYIIDIVSFIVLGLAIPYFEFCSGIKKKHLSRIDNFHPN